jgi:hypothetical protein
MRGGAAKLADTDVRRLDDDAIGRAESRHRRKCTCVSVSAGWLSHSRPEIVARIPAASLVVATPP